MLNYFHHKSHYLLIIYHVQPTNIDVTFEVLTAVVVKSSVFCLLAASRWFLVWLIFWP
jgi:hypothetical protein